MLLHVLGDEVNTHGAVGLDAHACLQAMHEV
jgi:hypothetical protein